MRLFTGISLRLTPIAEWEKLPDWADDRQQSRPHDESRTGRVVVLRRDRPVGPRRPVQRLAVYDPSAGRIAVWASGGFRRRNLSVHYGFGEGRLTVFYLMIQRPPRTE